MVRKPTKNNQGCWFPDMASIYRKISDESICLLPCQCLWSLRPDQCGYSWCQCTCVLRPLATMVSGCGAVCPDWLPRQEVCIFVRSFWFTCVTKPGECQANKARQRAPALMPHIITRTLGCVVVSDTHLV